MTTSLVTRITLLTVMVSLCAALNAFAQPAAPVLSPAQVQGTTVTLRWTLPFGTLTIYVEVGSQPGLSDLASFTMPANAGVTTPNVTPGIYYVRVRSSGFEGVSAPSNEIRVDVGGTCVVPLAPTGLTLVSNTAGVVLLSWNSSAGAATYVIEAGTSPGLLNAANLDTGSSAPQLTANVPGGGPYYVRVRARSACGVSAPSNEVIVTTNPAPGGLVISSDPDPAVPLRPGQCYDEGLGADYGGPQWKTEIRVRNTSGVSVSVTRWERFQYGANGVPVAGTPIVWDWFTFNNAFYVCGNPKSVAPSHYIPPGGEVCFTSCFFRRDTTGSQKETVEGVDDTGRPVIGSGTIQLPFWIRPQ